MKPITKPIWHIIIGGTIGNLTEWYNFLLYGYLAAVISQLFFPTSNSALSLTFTFTLFALSFLVRPIGGILFGMIGDVYGRQRALVVSLLMMGIPTLLIGCLPTYASIGIASPILLCFLRILQGLSAGGEHTGSAVYIAEHAPARRLSLWVSTVPTSAALGVLVSSLAAMLIVQSFSHDVLLAWGWRVGYWVGAALSLISLLLRISLPETPQFDRLKKSGKNKRYEILLLFTDRKLRAQLIKVFILASGWGVFYQVIYIWMPTYLSFYIHIPHATTLLINSLFLFILACSFLVVGFAADYWDRRKILLISCFGFLILTYPLFVLLSSGVLWKIYLAMTLFTLIFCFYVPASFVTMVESFPVRERYTGLSFGFNLGLALFGGTCPLIVTWLIDQTGWNTAPAFYMMIVAGVVLLKLM